MKILYGIIALVALVVGVAGTFVYQAQTRIAPGIAVCIEDETGGGTDYVPAINGYVSGHGKSVECDGSKEVYHADMQCDVVSTMPGRYVLLAHYIVTRDGYSITIDRTLPVGDKQPDKTKWVKLDNHLVACAYLTNTQLHY